MVSTLLFEERLRKATLEAIERLFQIYRFVVVELDARSYIVRAMEWCWNRSYSVKRVLDVAHLMAARDLGCRYIVAVDRFMKRHAREFNLIYVNYYTGVP